MSRRDKVGLALMADACFCLIVFYVVSYHGIEATFISIAVYLLGRAYLLNRKPKGPVAQHLR